MPDKFTTSHSVALITDTIIIYALLHIGNLTCPLAVLIRAAENRYFEVAQSQMDVGCVQSANSVIKHPCSGS
jgi:hypothetical protein